MNVPASFWLPPALGGLLALLVLGFSLRANRRRRIVEDVPTSKTTGVFIGLVELKGKAEAAAPLTSHLAEVACVWTSYKVEEHWSYTRQVRYTDSKGRSRTRTEHHSGWTTVAEETRLTAFDLVDDHGRIQVLPEGAKIEPQEVFSETCDRRSRLYYGKGPEGGVANSDHRRRFTETAIVQHAVVYVMGQARERQDMVAAEVAADKGAPLFLISTRTEEQIRRGFGWTQWLLHVLGIALAVGGMLAQQSNVHEGVVTPLSLVVAGLAYVGAALLGWLWSVYNSLIGLSQRVNQGWSQVDVQLVRRCELIPRVVETISGLRDHEKTVQAELAALRAQLEATPLAGGGTRTARVSGRVAAVAESYPELKSQGAFLALQATLADTETRIALARAYYNEIATTYNTRLQTMPDGLVAWVARLKGRELMTGWEAEGAAGAGQASAHGS